MDTKFKDKNPQYNRWSKMLQRSQAKNIPIHPRWLVFKNYLADIGEPPAPGCRLVKIRRDGPFAPENTKWSAPMGVLAKKPPKKDTRLTFNWAGWRMVYTPDKSGVQP